MPPRSALPHLIHMHEAASGIVRYTAGRTFEQFMADPVLRLATERLFEIVGEALNRLRRDDPATAGRLTDAAKIVGFRNVVAHVYDRIDYDRMWATMQTSVPVLIRELEALLAAP